MAQTRMTSARGEPIPRADVEFDRIPYDQMISLDDFVALKDWSADDIRKRIV